MGTPIIITLSLHTKFIKSQSGVAQLSYLSVLLHRSDYMIFHFFLLQPQILPVSCHLLMSQTRPWPSPGRGLRTGQTMMTLSCTGSPGMLSQSSIPTATENQKDVSCMVFVQGGPINSVSRQSAVIPGKHTANQFLDP